MNHPDTPATTSRARAALAAALAVLMTLFGTLTAPAAFAAEGASITAHVVAASETGLTVQVDASGLPSDVAGAYAVLVEQGDDAAVNNRAYAAFAMPQLSAGSTSFALEAPTSALDRAVVYEVVIWQKQSSLSAETLYGRSVVSISDGQWDAVFPPAPEPEPEAPEEPERTKRPPSPRRPPNRKRPSSQRSRPRPSPARSSRRLPTKAWS